MGGFGVVLARRTSEDAWTALYGSGRPSSGAGAYNIAEVVGFDPGQPQLLRLSGFPCDTRWPWTCEAAIDLSNRTVRMVRFAPARPRRFRDCPTCPELVEVPAGTFWMGSSKSEAWRVDNCPECLDVQVSARVQSMEYEYERPQHRVTISSPLAVGVSEVTFAEWDACVAGGGCGGYQPDDEGWGRNERPVINVNWNDAQAYVGWLTERTGATYRLLSEAEWEYVARAGTTTAWYWGDLSSTQCERANGRDVLVEQYLLRLTCDDRDATTAPVRSYPANAFGLHDTLGNVREWVQDCWHDDYEGAPADGAAWTRGAHCRMRVFRGDSWQALPDGLRVFRGGSWWDLPGELRAAARGRSTASLRTYETGFRVARTLE